MKKIVISLISLFTLIGIHAQDISRDFSTHQIYADYLQQVLFEKTKNFEDIDLENLNYTGSPYENDNFLPGEIYHKNKLIADNIPLRFNALVDEMELKPSFMSTDNEVMALMKFNDVNVRIGSKEFVFFPYQGGIEKGGYFEVLLSGEKVDLLKKHNKTFRPEQKSQSEFSRGIPARFSNDIVYYILLQDGRFFELELRTRMFPHSFIGMEKEITDYIKKEKLDVKNENHIINIVKHYNSL